MLKTLLLIVCTIIALGAYTQENKIIKEVIAEIKSFNEKENPPDTAYAAHPLGTNKEDDFIRRGTFYQKMNDKLDRIDQTSLSAADKVNLELLKYSIADEVISFRYKAYLNPILSDEGFHTRLPRLANRTLSSEKDLRLYLHTLKAIPSYVEEHLMLMRKGLRLGISQPAAAL